MRGLVWFRRDLRVDDNTALYRAAEECDELVLLYVIDREILNQRNMGYPRVAFLLESLKELKESVEGMGGHLTVRVGRPIEVLKKICEEADVKRLYFNRDYSPFALRRDRTVVEILQDMDVRVRTFKDLLLHEPTEILNDYTKQPYATFYPYWKEWKEKEKEPMLGKPEHLNSLNLKSHEIPEPEDLGFKGAAKVPRGGEIQAKKLLINFLE